MRSQHWDIDGRGDLSNELHIGRRNQPLLAIHLSQPPSILANIHAGVQCPWLFFNSRTATPPPLQTHATHEQPTPHYVQHVALNKA